MQRRSCSSRLHRVHSFSQLRESSQCNTWDGMDQRHGSLCKTFVTLDAKPSISRGPSSSLSSATNFCWVGWRARSAKQKRSTSVIGMMRFFVGTFCSNIWKSLTTKLWEKRRECKLKFFRNPCLIRFFFSEDGNVLVVQSHQEKKFSGENAKYIRRRDGTTAAVFVDSSTFLLLVLQENNVTIVKESQRPHYDWFAHPIRW